ncbi:MAG: hypothetical protein CVU00_00045 [Bacteroidetes bacterium HGW-Bacteroidetes-17]|jgi:hypothetical protein|nr:MAG: hypothetical protein CVU00_00045 [Bacteroidetes bacterium HGW-Bacteroidetes-17]
MKTNKILLGGIVAAVTFFFLGWLIYGMLLMDFMQSNSDQSMMKAEEDMVWWAMIVSNLASGFLLALLLYWTNTKSFADAVKVGGTIGLLMAFAVDLSFYSMSNMFFNFTPVIVDTIISAIMWSLAGIAAVWVMGLGKKA